MIVNFDPMKANPFNTFLFAFVPLLMFAMFIGCSSQTAAIDVDTLDFKPVGLYMRVMEPMHGMHFDLPSGWRRAEPPIDPDGTRWDGAFRAPDRSYLLRLSRRRALEQPFDFVMVEFIRKRIGLRERRDIKRLLKTIKHITPAEAGAINVSAGLSVQIIRSSKAQPPSWTREYLMIFAHEAHYYYFSFLGKRPFNTVAGSNDATRSEALRDPVELVARTVRFNVQKATGAR